MGLDAHSIPDATTPPPDAARSTVHKTIKRTYFSRRGVLRTALGAGVVVGMTSLNLLAFGKKAYAAPPTWGSCRDYDYPALPAAEFKKWAKNCNANGDGQHVSRSYCGGGGYHRTDSSGGGCLHYNYTRARRCLGKNAWVWRKRDKPPVNEGPRNKRCSDGWTFMVNSCSNESSRYKSTCIKYL
jgi:hypothetical protein